MLVSPLIISDSTGMGVLPLNPSSRRRISSTCTTLRVPMGAGKYQCRPGSVPPTNELGSPVW